jgi:hypothetical protein
MMDVKATEKTPALNWEHSALQNNWNFFKNLFVGHFCQIHIHIIHFVKQFPDKDLADRNLWGTMQIRIHNIDYDGLVVKKVRTNAW